MSSAQFSQETPVYEILQRAPLGLFWILRVGNVAVGYPSICVLDVAHVELNALGRLSTNLYSRDKFRRDILVHVARKSAR